MFDLDRLIVDINSPFITERTRYCPTMSRLQPLHILTRLQAIGTVLDVELETDHLVETSHSPPIRSDEPRRYDNYRTSTVIQPVTIQHIVQLVAVSGRNESSFACLTDERATNLCQHCCRSTDVVTTVTLERDLAIRRIKEQVDQVAGFPPRMELPRGIERLLVNVMSKLQCSPLAIVIADSKRLHLILLVVSC